jgi:polycystin 2
MSGGVIMFNAFVTQKVENELVHLLGSPDEFADFTYLGHLSTQNANVTAIAVFLAWTKLFKYLSFNKTMNQLTETLKRVFEHILQYNSIFS